MEILPNRSPEIIVSALSLDSDEVAVRRDFAQQHQTANKRLVQARVHKGQQMTQPSAAPGSRRGPQHISLVEADVLQHPRPTVTSTHTLREVDAIKAQLSSVTESQRQHQQQADAMMATFLERSQAQLDGIRDLQASQTDLNYPPQPPLQPPNPSNPADATPWIVTLPALGGSSQTPHVPAEVLSELHQSKEMLTDLVQEARSVLMALHRHNGGGGGGGRISGSSRLELSGPSPLDAYLARPSPATRPNGLIQVPSDTGGGGGGAGPTTTLLDRRGYDLGDANAVLARVRESKRVIDTNIDAMVSHDHPFDPEAILRRVLSDSKRAANISAISAEDVEYRSKDRPKIPKGNGKGKGKGNGKGKGKASKAAGDHNPPSKSTRRGAAAAAAAAAAAVAATIRSPLRPKKGAGQVASETGVRSVGRSRGAAGGDSARAQPPSVLPAAVAGRRAVAGPQSVPLARPLWSATPNAPRPHSRTSKLPTPSPSRPPRTAAPTSLPTTAQQQQQQQQQQQFNTQLHQEVDDAVQYQIQPPTDASQTAAESPPQPPQQPPSAPSSSHQYYVPGFNNNFSQHPEQSEQLSLKGVSSPGTSPAGAPVFLDAVGGGAAWANNGRHYSPASLPGAQSTDAAEMQLREMLAKSMFTDDLRTGFHGDGSAAFTAGIGSSRIARPVAAYSESSQSSGSSSVVDGPTANTKSRRPRPSAVASAAASPPASIANAMPNFDQIVRETLLAVAAEHAAGLAPPTPQPAAPATPAALPAPKVETADAGVGARTPTPQKRGVHAGSSPVMWAHRHQATQAEEKHRRASSPLAGPAASPASLGSFRPRDPNLQASMLAGGPVGLGIDTGSSPMGFPAGRRNVVSAGISPMPQRYGNDAGMSPMPQDYSGNDAGVSPMPQMVGRDAGMSPMPQNYGGNDAGVSPMPQMAGRDAGMSPMPQGYGGNDAGVSPMPGGYGRGVGTNASGRDAGISPMPQQGNFGQDAGVSPMPGARRMGDTGAHEPVSVEHSLPTWWTRLHEPGGDAEGDGSRGPAISKSRSAAAAGGGGGGAAAAVHSLDAEISEGEILLSSDGEFFPPRQLPPDGLGPDLFQTILGTAAGLGGSGGGGGGGSTTGSSDGEVGGKWKGGGAYVAPPHHAAAAARFRNSAYETMSDGQLSMASGLSEGEDAPFRRGGGGGGGRGRAAGSGGDTDCTDSDAATISEGQLLSDF